MSYAQGLNQEQKKNAAYLVKRMNERGITNPFTQAAILAIISKESEFRPRSENMNYSAKRIMEVWPSTTPDQAAKLASDPTALGNFMYGGRNGNAPNEGYKYRGRGYNQITFKNTYQKIGQQIGQDLVGNPDLLNDPEIAADAAIQYFLNGISSLKTQGKLAAYNAEGANDFKSLNDSTAAIYHVNAGIGKSVQQATKDTTGGRKKAFDRVPGLFELAKEYAGQTAGFAKKKSSDDNTTDSGSGSSDISCVHKP